MTLQGLPNPALGREALLAGAAVRARGVSWEVVHVEPAGSQVRYRLRCTEGVLEGREIELLSPFEEVRSVVARLDPRNAGTLTDWLLYHQAFLLEQAPGPSAFVAVPAGRLTIAPYQLVPVLRAISLSRPRLLLADGVGLGKTIEAGLIIAELIARRRARRVLIVTPSGPLQQQWRAELRWRFCLDFEPLADWATLQAKRRQLALGANPFDHTQLCVTSLDFAKQDRVLADLERCAWDLVIIDEAHHVMRFGPAGDAEDSRRRRLAELLACRCDGLLLLTATPHDGCDEHFASLVELLDPCLLNGKGAVRGHAYQRHVIRRLKHHLTLAGTNEPLFRTRVVRSRPVLHSWSSHARFEALQQSLLSVVAPRLRAALERRHYDDALSFVALLKRSLSTARACGNTLAAIARHCADPTERTLASQESRRQRLKTMSEYRRRLERYGVLSAQEELDQAELEAEDMAASLCAASPFDSSVTDAMRKAQRSDDPATAPAIESGDATLELLTTLIGLAEAAEAEDPKLSTLVAVIQEIQSHEPTTNIVVYTEYAESLRAAAQALRRACEAAQIQGAILALDPADPEVERNCCVERFGQEDRLVLLSTDAAAEGLNLHGRCHHLIHLELPLYPNRLEQRNGRIDRFGQRRDPVVWYLYLNGTVEERLLFGLTHRYEQQRAKLGLVPDPLRLTLSDRSPVTEQLLMGLLAEASVDPACLTPATRSPDLGPEIPDPALGEPYQTVLGDIDRALGGLLAATARHAWLHGEGLYSEPHRLGEAVEAQRRGEQIQGVELLRFVQAALVSDTQSASAASTSEAGVAELTLPAIWHHNHAGLLGFDAPSGRLLLTTNQELCRTQHGHAVDFLGRAHPVVRKAIDRVRSIAARAGAEPRDRRVSAATGSELALLFTYLGVVRSGLGREFERVIAVRLTPNGSPAAWIDPSEWLESLGKSVSTEELWERHFAVWARDVEPVCHAHAQRAFERVAEPFLNAHRNEQTLELRQLEQWVNDRAQILCGTRQAQLSLVAPEVHLPVWRTASDPVTRLNSLKGDATTSHWRRQQANETLSLYLGRRNHISQRQRLEPINLAALGILMVVPEAEA